jgi:PAS domain S-box-containing protein
VLLKKAEHLQLVNDQLALANKELLLARRELQQAKEDLERRVRERAEELRTEVAERKLAVEAQRESERRFQSVVESLGEGIIITDLDDAILYINARMADLTGYTPEEMIGKRAYELFLPESERAKALERVGQRQRGVSERYVVQVRRKDGSQFWCEVSARPYRDHEGNVVGTLGANTDVTSSKQAEEERQHLEEQIWRGQKLESLGVLAGGIAHDFNNLLTSMLGHAALALRKLTSDSPARRNIEQIETAAQRAADLTKQMLAYSGKGQFVVQLINLTKVVEEMSQLLHTVISKKARLRFDFPDDLLTIEGDPGQVRQVVMNLITNASDALGDAGGTISLATGRTLVTPSEASGFLVGENLASGQYVFLEVSDTGSGMDAETKARMFEPFFSTKFSGRGLGLAAVLGIVRGHGGAISVESESGRGTTIRVLLPASSKPEERRARPASQRGKWRGSGTFLVVDDEKYVRIVAKTILEEVGFTVITAADGREGLETFRQHSDEVVGVLLDMTMPTMSGDEVFQEIRKAKPEVPIILSSGHDEEDAVRGLEHRGRAGFIQKPYQPHALVEKVREVLGG